MIARLNPRHAHRRSQSIREQLRQPPGVFMRDDSGDGPSCRGVLRGKRSPTAQEMAISRSLVRALTLERILQRFGHKKTVNGRFPRKKTGLALMLAVRNRAPQRQAPANAYQRERSIGRDFSIMLLRLQ